MMNLKCLSYSRRSSLKPRLHWLHPRHPRHLQPLQLLQGPLQHQKGQRMQGRHGRVHHAHARARAPGLQAPAFVHCLALWLGRALRALPLLGLGRAPHPYSVHHWPCCQMAEVRSSS